MVLQDNNRSPAALAETALQTWVSEARAKTGSGRIPTYIPGLAAVDRDQVAVQVRFGSGAHTAGDVASFALMSVIKPFVLLFLLQHLGHEAVFERVGMLPSDQPFHSLMQLSADAGFPRNPMINSGAIALADLLPGASSESRCQTLCRWLNHLSGAQLWLDQAMLASVRSVGNETNRAIATVLEKTGHLHSVETALDTYNQICCLSGTVDDLARIGMLLAGAYTQITPAHQRTVNAVMLTCGLYEASGQFAVQVGVPAKSGVSGALLAIVPKHGAIACYSPALDEAGNSVAGLFLLEQLTRSLNLSIFG